MRSASHAVHLSHSLVLVAFKNTVTGENERAMLVSSLNSRLSAYADVNFITMSVCNDSFVGVRISSFLVPERLTTSISRQGHNAVPCCILSSVADQ
jgi:hypothetical protein